MSIESAAVTITAVDRVQQVLLCTDPTGTEIEISTTSWPKATGLPAEGERWVIVRKGNQWFPDLMVGAPTIPVITGSLDGMTPLALDLFHAMVAQGLVIDATTTTEVC